MARLRRARSGGFTLLELLIAITLLALLLAVLFGGLRTGSRVWEAGDQRSDDLARLQAAQGFLRRQIGDLFPLQKERPTDGSGSVAVSGTKNSFAFAGLLPTHFDFVGFQTITVAVSENRDGRHLTVQWEPFDDNTIVQQQIDSDERQSTLVENVASVRFAYFGAEEDGGDARWFDEWLDRDLPPALVRLSLEFDEGDRRYWPTLVVRVPSTVVSIDPDGEADNDRE